MTTLATINMDAQSPMHIILNTTINSGIVPDHQLKMVQRQAMAWQVRQEKYEAKQAEKSRVKAEKARLKYLKSRPSFVTTISALATEFGFTVPNFSYRKEPVQQEQSEPVLEPQQEEQPINDVEVKVCVAEIVEDDEVPENVIFQADRGEWEEVAATDEAFTEILLKVERNEYNTARDLEFDIYDVIDLYDTKLTRMAAYSLIDDLHNGHIGSRYEALQYFGENINLEERRFKTLAQSKQSIDNIFKMAEHGMWREISEVLADRGCYRRYPSLTYHLASSWLEDNTYHTRVEEAYKKKIQEKDILFHKLQLGDPRTYTPHIHNYC